MTLSVKEFQTRLKKIFPQALVLDASGEVESLAFQHPELNSYYYGEELMSSLFLQRNLVVSNNRLFEKDPVTQLFYDGFFSRKV
ncbi:MAG: hypothetical protein ABI921_10355 [Panacibacter sp.]